ASQRLASRRANCDEIIGSHANKFIPENANAFRVITLEAPYFKLEVVSLLPTQLSQRFPKAVCYRIVFSGARGEEPDLLLCSGLPVGYGRRQYRCSKQAAYRTDELPAPRDHSITSLARRRNTGGMLTLRDLAVRRLTLR